MPRFRQMQFSKDWVKPNNRFFTTIRVHRGELRYSPDEMVEVIIPKRTFTVHVLLGFDSKLKDVPLGFLQYDLEGKPGETRQDLINKLGKLYRFSEQPKESDTITIYFIERF